jgi:hypothetical protein
MKNLYKLLAILIIAGFTSSASAKPKWVSLFNGKDLTGWFAHGKATWSVKDGVLVGEGAQGHIYTDATCSDLEVKGKFRISGDKTNSGFYFRAVPPSPDPNGFPRGYEAQICNNQDAYTGWLWKPGTPTGKPTVPLMTKDNEWFKYRIKAVGPVIQFWINNKLVMTYEDAEYKSGHFAIQMHNPGMKIEARKLFFRDLSK